MDPAFYPFLFPDPEPRLVLGQMLNDIAKTASSAGDACRLGQNEEATNKVDELKLRIRKVSDMLSLMSVNNLSYPPPPPFLPFHHHQSPLDLSRKRGASDMDQGGEHRSLKALKREPQDDLPIVDPPVIFRPPSPETPPPLQPFTQPSPVDFGSGITTPMASASPTFSDLHTSWCDPSFPIQVVSPSTVIPDPINPFPATAEAPMQIPADVLTRPIGRVSRSNSASHPYVYINQYSTDNWVPDAVPNPAWSSDGPAGLSTSPETPSTTRGTPTDEDDEESVASDDNNKTDKKLSSPLDATPNSTSGSDVPQEYKTEVDRIFFEYLNKICSNLDATDSKGEPIHQTLMAKKMQRLDESPDFRPFKFRIQAFTLAFLEELARQGYPEEKIPMKKIRNYLWRQPYILRFNEDGKKAKSKGNHIWNIEAKKAGDGKWEFRPFHRKLAGNPPSVAYCGLKWSWTPRVWDPQASWQNVTVKYSSPSLPSWLAWKDDVLSGIPPPDAEDCAITVHANYVLDGQEGHLSHTFTITIAPVSASSEVASHSQPRRPSIGGDTPRRSTSDSFLCQSSRRSKARSNTTTSSTPTYATNTVVSNAATEVEAGVVVVESPDKRVIRVLQQAAQKVIMEAESQLVIGEPEIFENLEDLAKQKHVLEQTVDAYDRELSGQSHSDTRRLAVAAQHVVVQAAHTVIADKTGGTVIPQSEVTAIQSVTVSELSDATQDAIAEAVKIKGTATNDVDIIVTATSILKARAPGSPTTSLESLPSLSNSPTTSSNAVATPLSTSPGLATTRVNIGPGYTPNLSSLPEYV